MAFFPQQFAELGQLFPGRTLQTVLFRFVMHADPDAGVVQHCRNDRRFYYVNVRHAHKFRHQERSRAHDRGHQLPAGGSRRFYRARKSRTVT